MCQVLFCLETVPLGCEGEWITGPEARRIWVLQASPLFTVPKGKPCLSWDTFQVPPFPTLLPHAGSWGLASGKGCADSWTEYRSSPPSVPTQGDQRQVQGYLPSVCEAQTRPEPAALCVPHWVLPLPPESSFVQGASQLRALFFPPVSTSRITQNPFKIKCMSPRLSLDL